MNDLYARDTSSKIRAVKQSTFRTGKYVGCYAPIGYRKSPEDKHILEIDPVTAPVVLRIFDMRLQGDSFRKIARTLNEEGVPSPRGFYYKRGLFHRPDFAAGVACVEIVHDVLQNDQHLIVLVDGVR